MCGSGISYNPELIKHIEEEMDKSSKSFFDTTLNFIKWNTALAIAAILWFGNYLINLTTKIGFFSGFAAILTLIVLATTIGYTVGIFYEISKYFNHYWILCSEWRESVMLVSTPKPTDEALSKQSDVIGKLLKHYQNLPKNAERFDNYLVIQMLMLCFGLGCFVGFIITIKF